MPERDAAGDPGLRDEQAVRADPAAVADDDELIDLRPLADDGAAQRRALDRAARADLDVVLDDDVADLRGSCDASPLCVA
jgi:hypothetical protein